MNRATTHYYMKNKNQDLVILLTGTITPNSDSNLTIKDPGIREQQYLEALNFYIKKTEFKIVFTENSGDELENFPMLPDRIEYLSFKSEPTQPDRGIGFKELEIIDFAIQNSNFLKTAKSVAKITGRLRVLNFNVLSRKYLRHSKKKSNIVYANSFENKNMDSRCFFFTLDFWPYLKNVGQNINHRYNFELSLWDATYQYHSVDGKNYIPFYLPLRVKGISGSFGIKYKHNLLLHFARYIRNLSSRKFWQ